MLPYQWNAIVMVQYEIKGKKKTLKAWLTSSRLWGEGDCVAVKSVGWEPRPPRFQPELRHLQGEWPDLCGPLSLICKTGVAMAATKHCGEAPRRAPSLWIYSQIHLMYCPQVDTAPSWVRHLTPVSESTPLRLCPECPQRTGTVWVLFQVHPQNESGIIWNASSNPLHFYHLTDPHGKSQM